MLPLYVSAHNQQPLAPSQTLSPTRPSSLVRAALRQLRARYTRRARRWLARNGPLLALAALLAVVWLLLRRFPHHHRLPSVKRADLEVELPTTE
mmetsp:Transcript_27703/g.71297  ORF Transcript_27703/g.71297 Transcript_27703/m.71297 type:complete len:94 (+) Transcript_27703:298-579(+)